MNTNAQQFASHTHTWEHTEVYTPKQPLHHKPLMRDGIWAIMGWKDLQDRSLDKEPNILLWMAVVVMLSFILPVLAWSENIQVASADTLLPPPSFETTQDTRTASEATGVVLPVLKQNVRRGQIITGADLETRTVYGHVSGKIIRNAEELIGKEAFRPVRAGSPIYESHVRFPPAVRKNGIVPITFSAAGLAITSVGKALEDAAIGSSIRVMNESTGQTLAGVVLPNGTIEIQ